MVTSVTSFTTEQVKLPESPSSRLKMVSERDTINVPSLLSTGDVASCSWTLSANVDPIVDSSSVLSNTVPPLMNWMVGGGTPLAVQVMTVSSFSFTVITAPSNGSEMFGVTGI